MSKSLIKTVDGIGIWVRDSETEKYSRLQTKVINIIPALVIAFLLSCIWWSFNLDAFSKVVVIVFGILGIIDTVCMMILLMYPRVPSYTVYSGSEECNSIVIIKTTDPAKDQLAICRAAKEIESRCHEIAAKRAELDRIAKGCK